MALSYTGKNIHLNLDDIDTMRTVAHALSTELRLQILRMVVDQAKSVGEIARALDVPVSTVALNVQVMEKAGLVVTESQPGVRGMLKLVSRRADEVSLRLTQSDARHSAMVVSELPVGAYCATEGIQPTCGLAAHDEFFHMDDMPEAFWMPFRLKADLVWMREGMLEYRFPGVTNPERLTRLELSFEACSEAPGCREDWPSDIAVAVNGVEIGVWRSPGDLGGHRGRLNPEWWPDRSTQYGLLTTWRVDSYGTALEDRRGEPRLAGRSEAGRTAVHRGAHRRKEDRRSRGRDEPVRPRLRRPPPGHRASLLLFHGRMIPAALSPGHHSNRKSVAIGLCFATDFLFLFPALIEF